MLSCCRQTAPFGVSPRSTSPVRSRRLWPTSSSSIRDSRSLTGAWNTPCRCSTSGQSADGLSAAAGAPYARRAYRHDHRRKCRAAGLRSARPGRHRRADGHERAADPDARDSHGTQGRGRFTVVGGPWVTVREDYFGDLADVIFVGEAEETWPQFLESGKRAGISSATSKPKKTDMTTLPVPRYDLLKMQHYLFGSVQFSRGCPFQCEFCDIIVTFGRRPRLKTSEQILAELEAILRAGSRDCLHRRRQPDRQQTGDQGCAAQTLSTGKQATDIRSRSSPRRRSTWPTIRNCCNLMVDANISPCLSASKARTKSRCGKRRSIKTSARAARRSAGFTRFRMRGSTSGAA